MSRASNLPSTITVHVPMRFAHRGGRKTVVSNITPQSSQPSIDNALLKALAQAHRWRQKIERGEYASITELANTQRLNESYACRLLRLTLLAPAIVTDILNGRQRPDLTLKELMKQFPTSWDEQVLKLESSFARPCDRAIEEM